MKVSIEKIGAIPLGVEGSDEYLRIKTEEAKMWDEVHDWLIQHYYKDTHQEAGGYYCHRVTVMRWPNRNDEFVGVVHHRYDV